ncbi:hypothetical protein GALL_481920 [mine drainage metagenome]|uniref:Uncharacterized protein n=1 Tax=mine drainage metagenome TaxID=410659 RepID=A0A1J5PG68_9ZZZZ
MVLDEAGSPCRGHSVHRARKMSEPPGFWPGTQPRNRRAQFSPEATLERNASLPEDRILAYQKLRLCTCLVQQGSRFECRLARPDYSNLEPFERGEAVNPGGMGSKSQRQRCYRRRNIGEARQPGRDHHAVRRNALAISESDHKTVDISIYTRHLDRLDPRNVPLLEPKSIGREVPHRAWLECFKAAWLAIVSEGIAGRRR